MRLAGFLGHGGDLDLREARFFQEAMQGAFLEAEPDVGVELAGLLEGVLVEIEHENLTAGAQDPVGFIDRALRMLGVVQGLEQALALYHHEPGTLARRHWRYLHERTLGRMAPLADIIRQAACLAISRGPATGREEITRELMDEIILDHWSTLEYAEVKEVQARKARASRQGRKRPGRTSSA